jgi:hypothetical protein
MQWLQLQKSFVSQKSSKIYNIWWPMPLFLIFYFTDFVMIRVHFAYSNFAWRLDVDEDVRWSGGLFDLELH